MNRAERLKAMENAAAVAAGSALVPAAIRLGVAALVEEAKEQRARLAAMERAVYGRETIDV